MSELGHGDLNVDVLQRLGLPIYLELGTVPLEHDGAGL